MYGVVDRSVFEDFAMRTVDELLVNLRKASDGRSTVVCNFIDRVLLGVKRKNSALHGDLFLIRHILILREQLTPFETSLQHTHKHLDFTPTTKILSSFNTRSLLRFDSANGLVQLAIHGLPGIHDTLVDTKKEIDSTLKMSCLGMKQSSIKLILGKSKLV